MSIFFDFEVGPSGRRFRRAVDGDKHDIMTFMSESSKKLFGEVDIGCLIELSTLAICMVNEDKRVVGFMALGDYPNVPGVDPADWEVWIRNMFQRFYLSRNTLFIHYMCCEEQVQDVFLDEALVSVFSHDAYLHQAVLVVTPGCPDDIIQSRATKKRNVYKICAKRLDDTDECHFLYTFLRAEFCPKLRIRRAVEEDNDDIVEILDLKCPRLKELYGKYYISEIIGRHPESNRKIIVAEHHDRAVGVMCLNSDINYKKLHAMYELQQFYGLMKATPLEKEKAKRANVLLSTFGEPIMNGKWSPFQRLIKVEHVRVDDTPSKEAELNIARSKKISKVNFERNASKRKSFESNTIFSRHKHSYDDVSDQVCLETGSTSRNASYSITDLLEADPFDYDIVNIDSELLTIPDVLSFERLGEETQSWRQRKLSEIHKRRMSRSSIGLIQKNWEENISTTYQGEPNAFIIELFGLHEDLHERHSFEFLEAAFEVMKDYDYCVIRVPCKEKTFSLLQHFCFVPTKSKVCSKYALYVAHRSSLFGKLRVREAEISDVPQIASLLQNLDGQETVWTIENSVLNKNQYKAFVFLSGMSVVGVGILEQPEHNDFIRAKFNLDVYHVQKYHYRGQGAEAGFSTVKVALTYPAFEVHHRFFAREMMRFTGGCALLWLTGYRNKWAAHKANSMVSAMIPVLPRMSEVDCTDIPGLKKITNLSHKITAFSSWFLGKRMTSVRKMDINMRIVVVGASRTSMAFLDTLLFSDASSYLNFTSVTLVSPHGLPYVRQAKSAADTMFPRYRSASDKYMKSVPYTYYTNVIQGTMVEINKEEKFIRLSSGNKFYYDLLFLLLGKQYQHPHYLHEYYDRENVNENTPYVRLDVPRPFDGNGYFASEMLPENVYIINNMADANRAIKSIKNFSFWQDSYKVIVYGSTIHAYCCLASLLELKLPPENIVFVEPFPCEHKTRVPVFSNVYVDQTVKEVLQNLNIKVYRSYFFKSWTVDNFNTITHVEFLSHYKMINLECSAFFYYGKKGISTQALNAIKKSGLVYDDGILIDNEFRTKDPSIYAAGPATRYYRRYYADSYRLKYYDSHEVGETLAKQIRDQLDPLFTPKKPRRRGSVRFSTHDESMPSFRRTTDQSDQSTTSNKSGSCYGSNEERLPILKKPIVTHCFLPGGLQYLEVRPPGRKVPHYYVQSLNYNGFVMETFKSGYFKLHMNSDYVVNGITCLTPEKQSLDNFKNLYGYTSAVLNNVYVRYTAKKLEDFYEFFRENWAIYLYHERVEELFLMAKELLPKGQRDGQTLKEAFLSIGKTLSNPSYKFNTKLRMRANLQHSPHVEAITDYVIEWLSENEVLLPVYMQRDEQVIMERDLRSHPAFNKRNSVLHLLRKIF